MKINLNVPGNLLLCGEYAVLEDGGLGIILAVNRYMQFFYESDKELVIKSKFNDKMKIYSKKTKTNKMVFIIFVTIPPG